jgi:hypothetical protein
MLDATIFTLSHEHENLKRCRFLDTRKDVRDKLGVKATFDLY